MQLKKTPLTSAAKSNQKLSKTVLLSWMYFTHFSINEGVEIGTRGKKTIIGF